MNNKISAIICTYNPDVEKLKKVVVYALKRFDEVILVNDCSDIYIGKFKNVIYLKNKKQLGKKECRSRGVALANNDIVIFLEDNNIEL